ncbi:HAD family hydrolase [Bacillus pacificus]|uniref:HAD family hydrolase n=1 Tax=Bacillus pacificus TaxID=2026187 RepID=UPI003D1CC7A0
MKKVIFCDVDGTLIGYEMKISEPVRKAIKQLKEKGIDFVLSTGRTYRDIEVLDLKVPAICSNGAQIVDSMGEKESIGIINNEDAVRIIEHLKSCNHTFRISTEENNVIEEDLNMLNIFLQLSMKEKHLTLTTEVLLQRINEYYRNIYANSIKTKDILRYIKNFTGKIIKIEVFSADEKVFIDLKQDLCQYEQYNVFSSHFASLEIVNKDSNKGSAINKFMDINYSNEKVTRTFAIGDGLNDLDMFRVVDETFAMEDGNEELKKIAKHIIPCVMDDGILKAFKIIEEETINYAIN